MPIGGDPNWRPAAARSPRVRAPGNVQWHPVWCVEEAEEAGLGLSLHGVEWLCVVGQDPVVACSDDGGSDASLSHAEGLGTVQADLGLISEFD
eukprot:CAMPEP_0175880758 /NCGR_PEP_ID=MMETSP0107_2-20121207/42502_1 /TAXON_ID=195067 ORGANISM="Goniomonas pacifica, Strain CCMP1869" /NCGR_SAMPLE_ID=MMETSP0107_2 /ASSEMBLY_ACC=CAM_ASM_000203 /LENGTH=92 /DNA_ID=CAMNT_0017200551 /DNA_START=485 /DNA_END=761 /DNA_ORIENTATION=+